MRSIFLPCFFLFLVFSCGNGKEKPAKGYIPLIPKEQQKIMLVYSKEIPQKYLDTVERHLEKAFGREVEPFKSPALPPSLLSSIHKNRYRADSILQYMRQTYGGKALKAIMLTHHDISTTKYSNFSERIIKKPGHRYRDWAIFGLGSCPGQCCVVSVKRLWARNANEKTFLKRVKNISVHEVGHTFGLPHCPEPKCVMNDANETILTVDRSTGFFCETCKKYLGL